MADILYTHRIAKLLEEFVVGAGLTVHLGDDGSAVDLTAHVNVIKSIAQDLNIEVTQQTERNRTLLTFRRRR